MRIATLLVVSTLALAGCTEGAQLQDPRTGQTVTCESSSSPWAKTDACIAEHVAQGWTIDQRE